MAIIHGSELNDYLVGTAANTTIFGYGGKDALYGGYGNDLLVGGTGADYLHGGKGVDTASYKASANGVSADLQNRFNQYGDAQGDILVNIENLVGSSFDDHLYGNAGDNVLEGMAGNDILEGDDGKDKLSGGGGDDTLQGGDNDDVLNGGIGADWMFGGPGNDLYIVDAGDQVVEWDVLTPDVLAGDVGDGGLDTIESSVSWNLDGVPFAEGLINIENLTLTGVANINGTGNILNNVIKGNSGNNTLDGRYGNDTLIGGEGNDTLMGGIGADKFRFDSTPSAATNKDTITDFLSGVDSLQFSKAVMSGLGATGHFVAGDARFWANTTGAAHDASDRLIYNTSTGDLYYDLNGNTAGGATLLATLTGAPALTATDLWVV
jgi:serralysin